MEPFWDSVGWTEVVVARYPAKGFRGSNVDAWPGNAVLSVGACETLDGGWNLARMTSIVAVIRS
jgi:hypothetical protein